MRVGVGWLGLDALGSGWEAYADVAPFKRLVLVVRSALGLLVGKNQILSDSVSHCEIQDGF
jgi:hypothetical protein